MPARLLSRNRASTSGSPTIGPYRDKPGHKEPPFVMLGAQKHNGAAWRRESLANVIIRFPACWDVAQSSQPSIQGGGPCSACRS